jgi:hypothetical protein
MFYYRMSSEDLLQEARDITRRARGVRLTESADILIPNVPGVWGSDTNHLDSDKLALSVAQISDFYEGRHKDEKLMSEFIKNVSQDRAMFPKDFDRRKLVPGWVPLLDVLRAQMELDGTWKFPTGRILSAWAEDRGTSYSMIKDMITQEIVVGQTVDEEITDMARWSERRYKANQAESPTYVMAIQAKFIYISHYDTIRLTREEYKGKEPKLADELDQYTEEDAEWFITSWGGLFKDYWKKFPAKILLGDGATWQLVISFSMRVDGKLRYVTQTDVPERLLDLLEALPPLVAYNHNGSITGFLELYNSREVA